jgi:pimeloyl-ACP methyl ester carboxylesterase
VNNFNELIYSSLMSGIRPGTDPDIINHMCKRVSETLDQNIIRDYFDIGHQEAQLFPEKVDIPILLIAGEDDFLAPKEDSIYINQKIKGSQYICIPKSKHFPMAEAKEAFYEIIHRFCKEQSIS